MPSALATTPGVDIIVPVGSRERHVVSEARLEAAADVSGPIGAGFFVLRAPVLPIDLLQAAVACDRALQDWIADPWVRTALYLASPTLVDRLADWAAHPTDEGFARIRPALFRYFIRITSRPTPFGLFASFTTGRVGRSLEVALGPRDALRRSSWLDLGFLYPLVARAVDGPGVRKTLRYVANSTVTRQAEGWRYTQEQIAPDRLQRYLAHVDSNATLEAILESCHVSCLLSSVILCQFDPHWFPGSIGNIVVHARNRLECLITVSVPETKARNLNSK